MAVQRVCCKRMPMPAIQKPLVDDKVQPAHRCQPVVAEEEPHLYQLANLEAVYGGGDDGYDDYDDGDILVYCLKR